MSFEDWLDSVCVDNEVSLKVSRKQVQEFCEAYGSVEEFWYAQEGNDPNRVAQIYFPKDTMIMVFKKIEDLGWDWITTTFPSTTSVFGLPLNVDFSDYLRRVGRYDSQGDSPREVC